MDKLLDGSNELMSKILNELSIPESSIQILIKN